MRKIRVVNKGRFITFLALMLIITSIVLGNFMEINTAFGKELEGCIYITVKEGDTLWTIAQEHMHQRDIRKRVHILRTVNDLKEAVIHPGQQIKIPTK